MAKEKSRYHTFILYPEAEGFPDDWESRLETTGVPIAISPLHDKDKNKNGTFKKKHRHGMYIANNPVTPESVRNKLRAVLSTKDTECKAVAMVQVIHESVESVYRYLTHESKDAIAKKKHRYDKKDIILLNNFDIDRYITLSVEDKMVITNTLTTLIRIKGLSNVIELDNFIESEGLDYGLTLDQVKAVVKSSPGYFRLYFDAAYQVRCRLSEKESDR